jgi:single-strand selective monofunctional uracil DNA glycosylase
MTIEEITRQLSAHVNSLDFSPPVEYTYNPLEYAWDPCSKYLRKYGSGKKEVILVGMNPGPFGMAQTGVPFGDVNIVREWLQISGQVASPKHTHPKRPIDGFSCSRGEVSGQRLWGWARDRFGEPETFFKRFFVWNYCPLCFMESSGKNLTPDKLPKAQRDELFAHCDRALSQLAELLQPRAVIGVGKFAYDRAVQSISDPKITIGTILHPSPASPVANRGWKQQAEKQLEALGVTL